ncbi:hypothetical protein V1517DRAFT_367185 [Lipomyces orientalis]|uniref:Uncharacterized protein n=1 Tax=Lipomyces orientalis TaxID=1233043 RepID=A0ACC3TPD2_9ASCO
MTATPAAGEATGGAAVAHNSIIAQVQAHTVGLFSHSDAAQAHDSTITLELRGHRFVLQRDELMALPESVLLCLFPNGVFVDGQGNMVNSISGRDVISVDFSPRCLDYVVDTFRAVSTTVIPSPPRSPVSSLPSSPTAIPPVSPPRSASPLAPSVSILALKPAIIVLQEDLDYYVIPPFTVAHLNRPTTPLNHSTTIQPPSSHRFSKLLHHHQSALEHRPDPNHSGILRLPESYNPDRKDEYIQEPPTYADVVRLKIGVGNKLLAERGIFCALKRARQTTSDIVSVNPGETLEHAQAAGTAEKHLLDMLCSSGFHETDEWGIREREPNKTVISSLALVRLLATSDPGTPTLQSSSEQQHQHMAVNPMAQKLLLFWRKPARKCWWDQLVVKGIEGFDPDVEVTVHVRRMWTLELSVVGVH